MVARKPPPGAGACQLPPDKVVLHTDSIMDSKRHKTGADRSVNVDDTERAEVRRLAGVLDSLVCGMTGDRFGISSEVAVYCNAEQIREAINAWQALIALELSILSPP